MNQNQESRIGGYFEQKKRYSKYKTLGSGGMAVVYDYLDQYFQRHIAYKVLKLDRNPEMRRQEFIREARVMALLEHPGITPIHELITTREGTPCIVMAKVEGELLSARIEKARANPGEWPLIERIQVFTRLVEILSYAHHAHIVHRDIKPSNVMVGQYGEVTLLDWGLAKARGQKERPAGLDEPGSEDVGESISGAIKGTPYYMSPETAQGKTELVDEQSDIFSLGAIFYEMLTLKHLIKGTKALEVLRNAAAADYTIDLANLPGERQWRKSGEARVPPELITILVHCIEPDRSRRYRRGEDVLRDLRNLQNDRPLERYKSNAGYLLKKWLLRNRWPLLFIIIPSLLLLLAMDRMDLRLRGLQARVDKAKETCASLAAENARLQARMDELSRILATLREETQKIEAELQARNEVLDDIQEQAQDHLNTMQGREEEQDRLSRDILAANERLDAILRELQLKDRELAEKNGQKLQELARLRSKLFLGTTGSIGLRVREAARKFSDSRYAEALAILEEPGPSLDPFAVPLLRQRIQAASIAAAGRSWFTPGADAQVVEAIEREDELTGYVPGEGLPQGYEAFLFQRETNQLLCRKASTNGTWLATFDIYDDRQSTKWYVGTRKIGKVLPVHGGWVLLDEAGGLVYNLRNDKPALPLAFPTGTRVTRIFALEEYNLLVAQDSAKAVHLCYINSGQVLYNVGALASFLQTVNLTSSGALALKLEDGDVLQLNRN